VEQIYEGNYMLRIEVATSLRAVRNINENVFCRDTLTHLTAAKYPRCSPRCTLCVSSHPFFILSSDLWIVFLRRELNTNSSLNGQGVKDIKIMILKLVEYDKKNLSLNNTKKKILYKLRFDLKLLYQN